MIDIKKYSYAYSVWAWPDFSGAEVVINGIIRFFENLKTNNVLNYTVLERQTAWSGSYHDPDIGTIYYELGPRDVGSEMSKYPSHGYTTAIRYSAKMGSIRVTWGGIPIKPDTVIIFGVYCEYSSMYFTRADTNTTYFYPLTHHRGKYMRFGLTHLKQQ